MNPADMQRYMMMAQDWAIQFLPKVFIALIVFWVGMKMISKISSLATQSFAQRGIDPTIRPFFISMIDLGLKIALFLVIANVFGFETTSLVAMISALAFAVGLALQGSFAHFASGILLLIFKPYKVGDEVKIGDEEGFVDEIQVFNTVLVTRDNRKVIIPNGNVSSGNIVNLSTMGVRRVDMNFTADEINDLKIVKNAILKAVNDCPYVLKDREIELFLHDFDSDSLNFVVRPWCKVEDYWKTWSFMQEAVKNNFDEAGLNENISYVNIVDKKEEAAADKYHKVINDK